jgi:hypothetical protein
MIYRISIPALDPERVASALAELSNGQARPFRSSLPGSFMVTADQFAIEIYPDDPKMAKNGARSARQLDDTRLNDKGPNDRGLTA